MSTGPLSFWALSVISNFTSGNAFTNSGSCVSANNSPGVCTPLHDCAFALSQLTRLRSPVYCTTQSLVPVVCCPRNLNNYEPNRPQYPSYPPPRYPQIEVPNRIPDQEPEKFPTLPPPTIAPDTYQPPTKRPTRTPHHRPRDEDSITFHRLAERKCNEYSELVYENRSIFDFVSQSFVTELTNTCDTRIGPAVVGGTKASASEYPHMTLIGYNGPRNTEWLCGGALISRRFVVTAAHCIRTSKGSPTHVRIGDLNIKSETDEGAPQTIAVSNAIPHEHYRPEYVYNDIGLLELQQNVRITPYSRPACLHWEENVLPTIPLVATGWGRISVNGPSSEDLLEVTLEQFSTGECSGIHKPQKQIPEGIKGDSQICAGSRFDNKDTCRGDSGGPLQAKIDGVECMYEVIGITSFGRGCGSAGVPGVYTRVSQFVEWIEGRAFVGE